MEYKRLNLLIVPTNQCNLRCKYCYHSTYGYDKDKLSLKQVEDILEKASDSFNKVNIFWHGGEPLVMGIDFYKKILDIQSKISAKKQCSFSNKLQTNGTLVNEEWIDFFIKNNFGIGVSFDGPNNDDFRQQGDLVLSNIKLMKSKGLSIGVISVITQKSLDDLIKLYNWFNSNKISCKFNPMFICGSAKDDYALDKDVYAEKMLALFKYWMHDKNCNIRISQFDELFFYFTKQKYNHVCCHSSCLYHYLGITPNGDIYPCARAWTKDYVLGNISTINNIEDAYNSQNYNNLVEQAIKRRNSCMETCKFSDFCKGGCNNIALIETGLENNGGWTCYVTKKLCEGVSNILKDIKDHASTIDFNNYNPRLVPFIADFLKQK